MIIYPHPIIHCYLYKYTLTVCIYIFNQMYLLHFKDILIILIRQTTNTTDSKQVDLNTHTAWTDRVQSRYYVSFSDTDVLYHVSSTTSSKWKHRTVYKCSTIPCSVYKCISNLKFYLFAEVTQLIFFFNIYIERWLCYKGISADFYLYFRVLLIGMACL